VGQFLILVLLYFISISVVSTGWHVTPRFRVPMTPFIAIISARGWMFIIQRVKVLRSNAMKKILCAIVILFLCLTTSWAAASQWESQGNSYFLTKNTRESFSAAGAGGNKFLGKYLTYDGVSFLVKGADDWQDYGRLNLGSNKMFRVPLRSGMKVDEIHFLASGNYGNSYEHDALLHLYGETIIMGF